MNEQRHNSELVPGPQGLYHPRHERDACGVGFVCHLQGDKSHDIIHKALQILVNLSHRGACGCDEKTGDGAGILMQMPHDFLASKCGEVGIQLPDARNTARAWFFFRGILNRAGGVSSCSRTSSGRRARGCWAGATCPCTTKSSARWRAKPSR